MQVWFNLAREIDQALRKVAATLPQFGPDFNPEVRPADPRHGDFQANGVLPFAKARKQNPRALATALVEEMGKAGIVPDGVAVEIAGPGFINFKLSPGYLLKWLERFRDEQAFQSGAGAVYNGRKIVVDYSSPNTAKQMHVGHIRSMVIGEAIQRLLRFCGANVLRDNHIGDWGTQFGILIMEIKRQGFQVSPDRDPLEDFERIYREGNARTKADPSALEQARKELVLLQQGDPENVRYWQMINEASLRAFDVIYKQLGIAFDHTLGESFYRDKVDRVYAELVRHGLAAESQGALVVFHPEHPRFSEQPFIIRKSDGASNYASTDLATVIYRVEQFRAEELVYITDGRQQDHFQQLFLTVQKWFDKSGYPTPALRHVWFGTILGEDGKAIKTRSGDPVKLKDLLAEAVERAYAIVQEKNPGLSEDEKRGVARAVGLGAIRYADLVQNRTSDYVFSWDKILAFDGNTAPYLLYAVARIHSIFRKAGLKPGDLAAETGATPYETETEIALARKLAALPAALDQTISDLRPHFLCTYLYELSGEFSAFYNADKVITEDAGTRARRLILCARTLLTLETGLHLLGLDTLERM